MQRPKRVFKTKFVYFGDSQNNVLSQWSRVIRMANQAALTPFAIHAGDLVNDTHKDSQVGQNGTKADGFIHSQWTTVPVLGNHECL